MVLRKIYSEWLYQQEGSLSLRIALTKIFKVLEPVNSLYYASFLPTEYPLSGFNLPERVPEY